METKDRDVTRVLSIEACIPVREDEGRALIGGLVMYDPLGRPLAEDPGCLPRFRSPFLS